MTTLEEQIAILRWMKYDAVNKAEVWKQEAQRPGNKRGGINIGATPTTQARIRPRCTPASITAPSKKMTMEDYREFAQHHDEEINLLKDMLAKEVERRKEVEEEALQLKEKLARLKIEKNDKQTTATCRRSRLEAVIEGVVGPSSRGKKMATTSKADALRNEKVSNDKGSFLKENRNNLKSLKNELSWRFAQRKGYCILPWTRRKKKLYSDDWSKRFGKMTQREPTPME
ncbi:hypothetical protein CBR_g22153 [Chara braunii]|uniref:Uncharacterized protein n=1 Tax=Chara braunii TaxID=69332 RepID=A0A388L269_CHABU|nr:hypothetical protein CBR_g22153 [Chara braunii]|eukprot:GBG76405.1 hypothetical protein CBR_g22153 [Chara braunii]